MINGYYVIFLLFPLHRRTASLCEASPNSPEKEKLSHSVSAVQDAQDLSSPPTPRGHDSDVPEYEVIPELHSTRAGSGEHTTTGFKISQCPAYGFTTPV